MGDKLINSSGIALSIPNSTLHTYRCSKGHITTGIEPVYLTAFDDTWKEKYPFCPRCYMEWFKNNIPTVEEVKDA